MLAEVLQTNQWDNDFLGKFIQIMILGGTLGGALGIGGFIAWALNKRRPSVDVELTAKTATLSEQEKRIAALERNTPGNMGKELDDLESQLRRLADRVEVIAANQSKQMEAQAGNTSTINHIEKTVQNMGGQVQAIVKQMLELAARH